MTKTMEQLVEDVAVEGVAIISSNHCSHLEIAAAQVCGRFAVRDGGVGFVRRTQGWLRTVEDINAWSEGH
jgi:hypothetical protein